MPAINKTVPDNDQFIVVTEPAIGSAFTDTDAYPQNKALPKLFQPLKIRDVTFKNRIWVSPMCQYSSDNGKATDWHLVHLGGFATRGSGAITMEATAILPEGRISPEDAGIWGEEHIAPLQRIVNFAHAHGTKIGVQLAHAGRKASTYAPWVAMDPRGAPLTATHTAGSDENGWPDNVWGASDIPFSEHYPKPKAMTSEKIAEFKQAFVDSVKRCKTIGFDFIEIHGAHGYLLHNFYSPVSNKRTDEYGGSFENRTRLLLETVELARKEWGDEKPLFVRISASDWAEQELGPEKAPDGTWNWWGIEQSKLLVGELIKRGVDLVDVSSGGNWVQQKIPIQPGYQVPFAEEIRGAYPNLLLGTVGLITDAKQAEGILQDGKADVVFLARELLRRVDFPLIAAQELGVSVQPAHQYERAWARMLVPKH